MGKINFQKLARQPKYAIPLLVLPFAIGIILILTMGKKDEPIKSAAEVVVDLPDAVDNSIQSKSALLEKQILEEEAKNKRMKDSLDAVRQAARNDSIMKAAARQASRNRQRVSSRSQQGYRNRTSSRIRNEEPEQSEFEKFLEEVNKLDGLSRQNEAEENKPRLTNPRPVKEEQPSMVSKVSSDDNEYFQTLRDERQPSHIHAMVDEVVKGTDGTRVRIRLLDEIEVEGYRLEKGTYLYSFISGFGAMRVFLTISNIMVEDKIIPVNLSVYDLDANEGLYVPRSNFSVAMQESGNQLATSTRVEIDETQDSRLAKMGYDMMDNLLRMGQQTAAKNITKNKARIKYNTQVILVNK